jgi:hypothetical protein
VRSEDEKSDEILNFRCCFLQHPGTSRDFEMPTQENFQTIKVQKEELKKKWEFQQDYLMDMMNDAVHWQSNAESYDSLVRDYYIARQKHQKEIMRLNQILYGSENATVQAYSSVQQEELRRPLHVANNFCQQENNNDMILDVSSSKKRKDFEEASNSLLREDSFKKHCA